MQYDINGNLLSVKVEDITKQKTDAIVNAANGTLLGGGGVDGAIHRAAGSALLEACKKVRKKQLQGKELQTGHVVLTKGYELPAHFVIHTVGPIWEETKRTEQVQELANCYERALHLAKEKQLKSISFPSISTGAFRFPKQLAATTALETIINFLAQNTFGSVDICLFSKDDFIVYEEIIEKVIKKTK